MDNREKEIKMLMEEIEALPQESRNSIYWIIGHIDLVDQIAEGRKMSKEVADEFIQRAFDKKDHIMLALVYYKQAKDELEAETT